ncbi:unnamed protein product [Trypanosoma congolense IL3000]|uniref:WGS project CAEQ00000000 data, annotated contig 1986 n=1 Tax=Trypanosoma congolense (strain IL3000) TaxID=1068625 RepID=F9WAL1_TRYCI|nr:unnamed protein product [Trypanosoma congolense IL3000]
MEKDTLNSQGGRAWTMDSTVEAVLERARDDWGAISATTFFSIYHVHRCVVVPNSPLTLQQYLKDWRKFVPDSVKGRRFRYRLWLMGALMRRHLDQDLARLRAAKVVTLEDWQREGDRVDIGPMARALLTDAFLHAVAPSSPSENYPLVSSLRSMRVRGTSPGFYFYTYFG